MLKNATLYLVTGDVKLDHGLIALGLENNRFVETMKTQSKSVGWVAPREKNGLLAESIGAQTIAKLVIETRTVPADAVKKKVEEMSAKIEESIGRKPGRKETREIKEQAIFDLMPNAFPKQVSVLVWFDIRKQRVVIDSTSQARCDDVISAIVNAVHGLALQHPCTKASPASLMVGALVGEAYDDIYVGRSCELRATDESKAVVRYRNKYILTEDVRTHIKNGMVPAKLDMTFEVATGGGASFTLNESGSLSGIKITESIGEDDEDSFDADVVFATSAIGGALDALIDAMGGLVEVDA